MTAQSKMGSEYNSSDQEDVAVRRLDYFTKAAEQPEECVNNFMKFMSRQNLAKLITYYEIFNQTRDVAGSFVECGVFHGNGLMTWAKLLAAFEPYNYPAKVIGFDTFEGNVGMSEKDESDASGPHKKEGGYFSDSLDDLKECIDIFDKDRPVSHIPMVELVKGDLRQTAKEYVEKNRHLVVRVLSLTVNLYEPTLAALKAFVPRMSKGSVIVPLTLNNAIYPGMTESILDELKISDYSIKTFPYSPNVSMIIL